MARKQTSRRTATLSISLPPELARVVSIRVQSGLYSSASELIREALRLMLKVEEAEQARLTRTAADPDAPARPDALRFATTMELFDLGMALREKKVRADEEAGERLRRLDEEQEAGPGLRIAPERLERLKLRE